MIPATAENASYNKVVNPPDHNSNGMPFPPSAIHAQLERILVSGTFVRSKRLGRFLSFTVEQCLEGNQNALKEYLVGVEVFNKLETFDPRIDSIVRVEARRLRSKLDRYYLTEGRDDQIVIQFRKGSYVPLIISRDQMNSLGIGGRSPQSGRKCIAVSQFNNLGVEAAYSYFCSGLTEDVISALTRVPEFRIMARNSNFPVSDDVHIDYVLEGSVRKQGERLRISAQLIDVADKLYIWSETYERELSDAFAVQDEISKAIVQSIRAESLSER